MPGKAGYLVLCWDYGPQTDMTILKMVRAEFDAVGEQVYPTLPAQWDTRKAELQKHLAGVVKKRQVEATWRTDENDCLTCECNIVEFDVHAVDEKGIVSEMAHKETGPQENGFIVRLSPLEKTVQRQPKPMAGFSYGPYWKHQFCVYDEYNEPFRLDLLYGKKTDENLWRDLSDAIREHFREAGRTQRMFKPPGMGH